jgi:CelD/BcsL family acetyltransferase involved in cellulose biosynthesis
MQNETTLFETPGLIFAARDRAVAAATPIIVAEIINGGVESIRGLAPEWAVLCAEAGDDNPFARPEWFESFAGSFDMAVKLVVARRDGKLCAVLPLTETTDFLHGAPVRKLQALFNLQTQRFDLIHSNDETLRETLASAIWKALKGLPNWQAIELRLVPKDSWISDVAEAARRDGYQTGIWEMDGAPYVSLPTLPDPETAISEFNGQLKRRFRNELKRRLKRLGELGNVEFVRTHGYSSEQFDQYLEIESRGWKGSEGTAAACDSKSAKLHHDFARRAAANGALYIYQLRLDGKTIAISVNLKFGKKTIFWKTSFDEGFSRYSPGNLLIQEFIADAIRMGSTELDMLSPAADYKMVWATGERKHAAFYIFRKSAYGRVLAFWKFGVITFLRRFKKPHGGNNGKS